MSRRLLVAFAVGGAVLLAAGCGSSKSSSSSPARTTASSSTRTSAPQSALTRNGKINYAKPPAHAPTQSGVVTIRYHDIAIEPDTLKVKVGSTIKWVNEDPVEHNVTSASGPIKFASAGLHEGETFTVKLTKPGVIHYQCTIHPVTMNGTIQVVG